jgi:hypothetical protein
MWYNISIFHKEPTVNDTPDQVREPANTPYGQKPLLTREEIRRIVEISQRIEGYEPASPKTQERVRALFEKYDVKVSL